MRLHTKHPLAQSVRIDHQPPTNPTWIPFYSHQHPLDSTTRSPTPGTIYLIQLTYQPTQHWVMGGNWRALDETTTWTDPDVRIEPGSLAT